MNNIKQFKLNDKIYQFMADKGFETYTPIQEKVIPVILQGKDLIGISATGSGKTLAFLLPIVNKIDTTQDKVQAIVTAPTRELARQIYDVALEYQEYDPEFTVQLISGEVERSKMEDRLKKQPQLVIGTPGRLKDAFLNMEVLRLDSADILCVDEADMTMEFGFLNDVDAIAGRLKTNLQMLVFSATIFQAMEPFLKKYLHAPTTIKIADSKNAQPQIDHILIPCKHLGYKEKLLKILPGFDPYLCLIFANSKKEAVDTANYLRANGYPVTEIHGDLSTRERKNAMKVIQNEAAKYVVCSDIASRGMDITGVSHVVSLGFPSALEYYIHRAGRTGRAGQTGICYALYKAEDDEAIKQLKVKGIKFDHKDYRQDDWQQLKPYGYRRVRKNDLVEKEIAKVLTRKNEKVKPNYRKKKQTEIERIKRKQRRELIRKNIKEQQKERAKQKQREKSGY